MKGRVLIVAGSDSGGGAGIQADIKTVTALGGFAMTAVTALTAQNTLGVHGVIGIEPGFIRQQIEVVIGDLGVDAIKTGMLHSTPVIEAVASAIRDLAPETPLVVDPVMVAKGGAPLLEEEAVATLRDALLPLATVVTPNLPEAGVLLGRDVSGRDRMEEAANALRGLGPAAVLLKGGHLPGSEIVDFLAAGGAPPVRWTAAKIDTRHTHGTGCTLASAVAAGLAQGLALEPAVSRARNYVRGAIQAAPGYGAGHGPLNHAHGLGTA
ncbi:MAG: bifunctional hydroxymethylpyrimidine kinase/phosphomethylpyrimidine kinase [Rhodospirillaceae bacterium]|nr:bifunctional hydroxymethylpyrimidine kinase/phosphomethylpyrimidine kinase [Rhodospirillaceae bacterium]